MRVLNGLAHLTNVSIVRIAGGFQNGVSFNYSALQSAYSNGRPISEPGVNDFTSFLFDIAGNTLEQNFLGNTAVSACQDFTGQFCLFGLSRFTYPDTILGGFTFSTSAAIDMIAFSSIVAPQNERASNVPELGSIAMLGLGIVGLLTARRESAEN